MIEPDVERVTERLTEVLAGERREAMVYTALTVLCVPAFVAIASLTIVSVILYTVYRSEYRIDDAVVIYTGMTAFLASALGLTSRFGLDRNWLAGATIFLVLICGTYATSLQETWPACFGILYFLLAFLVLGLAGRTHINRSPPSGLSDAPTARVFALVIAGSIVSAYAELISVSWLWVPPKLHEVRIAARVLCRLATGDKGPLHERVLEDRIERLLLRLKLAQRIDHQLHVTPKGLDLVRTVNGG